LFKNGKLVNLYLTLDQPMGVGLAPRGDLGSKNLTEQKVSIS